MKKNCAALCIEYGSSIQAVPEAILAIANRHQFPIIVFHEAVPFVRITQDLHSQIINQQYLMVSTLESYSLTLNKKYGVRTKYGRHLTKYVYRIKNTSYVFY
ncbi:PucR family transcriptional regulator ligand-binding domain-containing protein [Lysinibacillus sp. MHQ-1]|nr:PucR family transcriptional regulator ligand-binding domain-containing protein [Lysinibacillus sp. MHQ-1]